MSLPVGTRVKKRQSEWLANDFDDWGRGEGIGIVVEAPIEMVAGEVDVQWPNGRCFENVRWLEVHTDQSVHVNLAHCYCPNCVNSQG